MEAGKMETSFHSLGGERGWPPTWQASWRMYGQAGGAHKALRQADRAGPPPLVSGVTHPA
ncbi:hypothetical protein TBS_18490 [Thermobispora bispora]